MKNLGGLLIVCIAFTLSILPVEVFSCAKEFPERVLVKCDYGLLAPPSSIFSNDLDALMQLVPDRLQGQSQDTYSGRTYSDERDIHEFSQAVATLNLSAAKSALLINDYSEKRSVLSFYEYEDVTEEERNHLLSWAENHFEQGPDILRQYYGYLLGAISYHSGEKELALQAWRMVLLLPEHLRLQRSVWAAYMIGRLLQTDAPDQALQWYTKVQGLVAQGFGDSLDLVRNIHGWQAMIRWRATREPKALLMYLQLGDKQSLVQLCSELAKAAVNEEGLSLQQFAQEPWARRIITLYLISRERRFPLEFAELWFDELSHTDAATPHEAEEIAWFFYKIGRYAQAEQWLHRADDSILTKRLWIKLSLRSGNIDKAVDELAGLIRELPPEERRHIPASATEDDDTPQPKTVEEILLGELGTLYLSRGLFVKALDTLYKGGYWGDAAYVAERVLTSDELISYVDGLSAWQTDNIRHLLARRLARECRLQEAGRYYPAHLHEKIQHYQNQIVMGRDTSAARPRRAQALAEAARSARYNGAELLATEVEPDWYIHGCQYEQKETPGEREGLASCAISAMSSEEARRLENHEAAHPVNRFHYRYTATELAWEAAQLLPDNTNELAHILCEAGSWLKNHDPHGADRFYKSMVLRAGKTDLGKAAADKRWFPDCGTALQL